MGFLDFLEKSSEKFAERKVKKLAIDSAKTMLRAAFKNSIQFIGLLKPHEFAVFCIYGRPRWSKSDDFSLLFDGLDTGISITEGRDIADIIEFVVSIELAANPHLKNITNGERLIPFAGKIAKQYVIDHCDQRVLINR